MTLVIVGDIEKKQALDLAAKYFNQTRDVPAGKLYQGENKVTFTKSIVVKALTVSEEPITCLA